ncbi:MAG: glycerol-3-phosphate acyltransferase [Ilumatobacteraceae bacterium]
MSVRSHGAAVPLAALVGYLAGTVPSASLASRLASGGAIDLRTVGSGNPGALNAAQQLGTMWGVGVLVADAAKGFFGALAGRRLAGPTGAYLAATMAIAGHVVPVWSGFRGGKGVATSAGACLAVFPAYFPIDAAVAVAGAAGTRSPETAIRISSLAWTLSAILWWRKRWQNAWGPPATAGLPAFAASGSAIIVAKFAHSRAARRRR